ncbi:MAG: DNA primase [Beijerinckiaceae bacterium]|nr:DNA primase [Beijerinckiaceae bacterium]
MSDRDAEFEDWIGRARRAPVREYLQRKGLWTQRMMGDRGTACPACGGDDRFAINTRKNLWNCRKSGMGGGALAFEAHLRGLDALRGQDFLDAAEAVTGEAAPTRSQEPWDERQARLKREAERLAQRQTEITRAEASAAQAQRQFRERERTRAWKLWRDEGREWRYSDGERYLGLRRCEAGDDAALRFHPVMPFWHDGEILFRGPAMLAAITGPDADEQGRLRFSGLHVTWLDLDNPPKYRRVIAHPATGEILPAKKVRGSQKGGSILLVRARDEHGAPCAPCMIVAGEGIETTLAAWNALRATTPAALEGVEFRAFVNLGNFAGKARETLRHPTESRTDTLGRVRAAKYPGPEPMWPDDIAPVPIPPSCTDLVWLMDADGDQVRSDADVARGAARYSLHYPWLTVRVARPEEGCDFAQMRQSQGEAA